MNPTAYIPTLGTFVPKTELENRMDRINSVNVEDFLDFCLAQGSKRIQHFTPSPSKSEDSAWCSCALGEYYTHLTGEILPSREADDGDSFPVLLEHALDALGDAGSEIFDALGNYETKTYRELVRLLRKAGV